MSSAGQPTIRLSPFTKWEYHILAIDVGLGFLGPKLDIQLLGETLSRLGREGWELVPALRPRLRALLHRALLGMASLNLLQLPLQEVVEQRAQHNNRGQLRNDR